MKNFDRNVNEKQKKSWIIRSLKKEGICIEKFGFWALL